MIDAQIDNYRIIEKIGDGGMGSVYKAVDVMLEREVALKFLRPELAQQKDLVDRFRAEAIVLARLSHQNIASLYGLHRHGDELFMAMEYVPGSTLEAMLTRDRALPLTRAVAIAGDVLQALDYAHKRGVVHRDVKSANIIVPPTGGVKVMDFGIARVLGTERRTRVGFVVGTIGYMAPEQIQGLEVDGRTDIYALGVVLYEMLTGRLPFQGDTEYAVMQAQIQQMPVPPRAFAPVPIPVENTILRSLAKLPQERFQTATEFHLALEASVRQSAMYPAAASAPFSASGDETREFKSDPQLLAFRTPPSGVLPVSAPPFDSDVRNAPPPLPGTSGSATSLSPDAAGSGRASDPARVAPTQASPTPPPVGSGPHVSLPATEPALHAVTPPSTSTVPTGEDGGLSGGTPAPAGTDGEFDPDATIRLGSSPWRSLTSPSRSGDRPAWDQPTMMTPVPGPPPSPPAVVGAPPQSTGNTPVIPPPVAATTTSETLAELPPAPTAPRPATTPLVPSAVADAGSAIAASVGSQSGVSRTASVPQSPPPTIPPPVPPMPMAAPAVSAVSVGGVAAAAGTPPLPIQSPVAHAAVSPPVVPAVAPTAVPVSKASSASVSKSGAATKKGSSLGLVLAAAALIVLGALGVLGYVVWQRWQATSSEQAADALTTTSVLETLPAQDLTPAVDPGVAPVAPAVPQPPPPPTARTAPRATTTVLATRPPEPSYEPVPSPVPPTVVVPQLAPASPEVRAPAAPPVMFGGVKWMRVDGARAKEVDSFLQLGDQEVRVLDDRVRTALARMPFGAISHVTYSSGKRPAWRKDIGPVPSDSVFDSTVRTFHYIAFQGTSQFLLVRVKDGDVPRLREELKKRANLSVETAR